MVPNRAGGIRSAIPMAEAATSYERALGLVTNESERRFLERRLHEVQGDVKRQREERLLPAAEAAEVKYGFLFCAASCDFVDRLFAIRMKNDPRNYTNKNYKWRMILSQRCELIKSAQVRSPDP